MSFKHAGFALGTITLAVSTLAVTSAADAANIWRNCTSVNHHYRHGVGRTTAHDHVTSGRPVTNFRHSDRLFRIAMAHNKGLDRDHDKIACEKH